MTLKRQASVQSKFTIQAGLGKWLAALVIAVKARGPKFEPPEDMKKWGIVSCACDPNTKGWRREDPRGLAGLATGSMGDFQTHSGKQ